MRDDFEKGRTEGRFDPRPGHKPGAPGPSDPGLDRAMNWMRPGYGQDQRQDYKGHPLDYQAGKPGAGEPEAGDPRTTFNGRAPWDQADAVDQASDERLREKVVARLAEGLADTSTIAVNVLAGEVTLEGHVQEGAQRAVELIRDLSGVKKVHDHLR